MPPLVVAAGIGALGTVGGAALASSANKSAAKTQADSTDKALDYTKQLYEQQRGDLANYRAAGQGSVGQLSYLLGVPGFEGGAMAPQQAYQAKQQTGVPAAMTNFQNNPPAAITPGNGLGPIQRFNQFLPQFEQQVKNAAAAGNAGSPSVVPIQAPNGKVYNVPQARVQEALAQGGKQVGG